MTLIYLPPPKKKGLPQSSRPTRQPTKWAEVTGNFPEPGLLKERQEYWKGPGKKVSPQGDQQLHQRPRPQEQEYVDGGAGRMALVS